MYIFFVLACVTYHHKKDASSTDIDLEAFVISEDISFLLPATRYCLPEVPCTLIVWEQPAAPFARVQGMEGYMRIETEEGHRETFANYGSCTFFQKARELECSDENPCHLAVDLDRGGDAFVIVSSLAGQRAEWELAGSRVHLIDP